MEFIFSLISIYHHELGHINNLKVVPNMSMNVQFWRKNICKELKQVVNSWSDASLIKYYIMIKNHLVSFWIEQHVGFHMNISTPSNIAPTLNQIFFLLISKSRHEKHIQRFSNVLDFASFLNLIIKKNCPTLILLMVIDQNIICNIKFFLTTSP
jgi:hypothetical protein